MKAILIKTIDGYHLRSLIKDIPRSINVYHKISKNEGEFGFGEHSGKLSKQNCDEIFGVVDVEKLADAHVEEWEWGQTFKDANVNVELLARDNFCIGFNKAMELNKDKVFTLFNLRKAFNSLENHPHRTFTELVALLQPSEIEVEIEMEYTGECNGNNGDGCFQDSPAHNCGCFQHVSKLDSNGCLILKKI